MATLAEQIAAAKDAYHRLMIGEAAVSFTDQNGESVTYKAANAALLASYIMQLESQQGGGSRTHTVRFSTSKGI